MTHKISLIPLDELQPNPLNPKDHDQALLNKSFSTFGYIEPIVVDERTGYMVSGHGRKEVLEKMRSENQTPPAGITVEDGQWLVPVVTGWASKDDVEAHGALVALNRTTERGGWNRDNLFTILKELSENNILDSVGYANTDILILERSLEAQDVFTTDINSAIDEFIGDTGVEADRIAIQYSTVLRVYFQTEESRKEFFNLIGYKDDGKQLTIRYPASFQKSAAEVWNG